MPVGYSKLIARMKKIVMFLMTISLSLSYGQDYRFGKVDPSDFERITPEGEEEPVAEVLYRKEHISFRYVQNTGFVQTRSVHERIKINSEEGLDYATKKVRLYDVSASRRERLKGLKGYTYFNFNGDVSRDKLTSNGEFEEKLNEYWKQSSFTMPNAQVGSIIEYEYDIVSPFNSIDDVVLQYDIPIHKMDISIMMIEYFTYNVFFNPRASYVPEIIKSLNNQRDSANSNQSPAQTARTRQGNESIQYTLSNQILILDTENVPALVDEPLVLNRSEYRAKIVFELASTKLPDGTVEEYSTSWESVVKSIYDRGDFGDQLNKRSSFYEDDLAPIIAQSTDPLAKIKLIYEFVRSKVKWNNYYGYTVQKGLKDAYQEGSGNVADINLLLTSMLQSANIQAYPVLVSSKNNGIPLFPTREGYDYVISVASIGDKQILLDATDLNLSIGDIPLRASNWYGRAVKEDGSSYEIDLMSQPASQSIVLLNVELADDMRIKGEASKRFTNFTAYKYREQYRYRKNEDIVDFMENDVAGLEIKQLKIDNVNEPEKPVNFAYKVLLSNSSEAIGDKIYVTPLLNETINENPYKLDSRSLPVELDYPTSNKRIVNLVIPAGYEVVSLPESVLYEYNTNSTYKFVASASGSRITIQSDLDLNEIQILPPDYIAWKNFYTAMVAKEAEKIVLKKI